MTALARDNIPKTLLLAEDESRQSRCFFVGTEHLFLAIARQSDPAVGRLLASYGTTLEQAVARVRDLIHFWEPDENWSGLLRHTERVRRVSQRAVALADRESGQLPQASHFLMALLEQRQAHTTRAILGLTSRIKHPAGARQSKIGAGKMSISFSRAEEQDAPQSPHRRAGSILEHFGRDLTELALRRKLPPLIGRERELRLLVRTLTRQTKPNPIIVGEPGTGKTALVEGLARLIVDTSVPAQLQGARVIELSLASLVAGTQYRGEFEKRFELILAEAAERPEVILFLDEFHLAIGAGAAGGSMDAANILKPALARGSLRLIAATTLREYRQYVEPDAALSRRFQSVMVNQPDEDMTVQVLTGIRSRMEEHHCVQIPDDVLVATVRLSDRYQSARQQPDKSIDLLDDACTRVTLPSIGDFPPMAQQSRRIVTLEHVAQAVSDRTGIPVGNLTDADLDRLTTLGQRLAEHVVGQTEAVAAVVDTLRRNRVGLGDANRPIAVLLFAGSSGIGKTALAEVLAREYFGLQEALVRIDLSEYMDAHNVSRLIGAPPGYIGHDEQGQLTRALRVRPYSLVLLDEIEKAHPDVCDIFLQVFGSGRLTDGRGDVVDCRQSMFVMTTNLGCEAYRNEPGFGFRPIAGAAGHAQEHRTQAVRAACEKHFRSEFLNRVDRLICFNPLTSGFLRGILDRLLEDTHRSLEPRRVSLQVPNDVRDWLVNEAGTEEGVPPLKRLFHERILNRVAELIVAHPATRELSVRASIDSNGVDLVIEENE